MSVSTEKHFTDFLEYLIVQCKLGRHVHSNIGVMWLENLCKRQLKQFQEGKPFFYGQSQDALAMADEDKRQAAEDWLRSLGLTLD